MEESRKNSFIFMKKRQENIKDFRSLRTSKKQLENIWKNISLTRIPICFSAEKVINPSLDNKLHIYYLQLQITLELKSQYQLIAWERHGDIGHIKRILFGINNGGFESFKYCHYKEIFGDYSRRSWWCLYEYEFVIYNRRNSELWGELWRLRE